mmetsp:Transcript_18555/g.42369  ORF Transcript_18555/g.42369 Transcript_18555/m.42369 type:complete len:120 (-) Transcript_18555:27-386(-)
MPSSSTEPNQSATRAGTAPPTWSTPGTTSTPPCWKGCNTRPSIPTGTPNRPCQSRAPRRQKAPANATRKKKPTTTTKKDDDGGREQAEKTTGEDKDLPDDDGDNKPVGEGTADDDAVVV